jgi:hypothetical protein
MSHDHNSHVIDTYVADLALAWSRPKPATTFGVTDEALQAARRSFSESRLVARARGDRPSRLAVSAIRAR